MKTIFFFMLMLLATPVWGQKTTSGGLLFYPGRSKIGIAGLTGIDERKSFQFGAMIQFWGKSGRTATRVGFLYSRAKGSGILEEPDILWYPDYPIPGETYTYSFERTDFMVPIEFLFDITSKPGGLYFIFGPALALKMNHKTTRDPAYAVNEGPRERGVEIWANIGLGYRFKAGDKTSFYIQPTAGGNFPSTLLGILTPSKSRSETGAPQVNMYGVTFGIAVD